MGADQTARTKPLLARSYHRGLKRADKARDQGLWIIQRLLWRVGRRPHPLERSEAIAPILQVLTGENRVEFSRQRFPIGAATGTGTGGSFCYTWQIARLFSCPVDQLPICLVCVELNMIHLQPGLARTKKPQSERSKLRLKGKQVNQRTPVPAIDSAR